MRYLNSSESFVVVWGTGSGSPRDPDWFQNLRNDTVAHVLVGATRQQVRPRELVGKEREAMWKDVALPGDRLLRHQARAGCRRISTVT